MFIFASMNPTNLWPQGQVSGYCFYIIVCKGTNFRAMYQSIFGKKLGTQRVPNLVCTIKTDISNAKTQRRGDY
jgi:hypothetical protein